jgi:hypothetical protein
MQSGGRLGAIDTIFSQRRGRIVLVPDRLECAQVFAAQHGGAVKIKVHHVICTKPSETGISQRCAPVFVRRNIDGGTALVIRSSCGQSSETINNKQTTRRICPTFEAKSANTS